MATNTENFNTVLDYSCKIINSAQPYNSMPSLTTQELQDVITIGQDWTPEVPMTDDQITLFRSTVKTVFSLTDSDELVTDDEKLQDYISRAVHSGCAFLGLAKKLDGGGEGWQDWDVIV
jgi:hypothetical protein|tara:strand:+ start:233 stop:589 length:357 start_codon:yes stop_codon:yes gene_type:complete